MLITTKKLAISGVLAAVLIGGMWALKPIPHVEVVTIILATAAFVFGPLVSVLAALAFVLEEALIWGFGPWVVSYLIYWPLVAAVFSLLGMLVKTRRPVILTVAGTSAAVLLTIFFGALTSAVDVALFSGKLENFGVRFAAMYAGGIVFFAVHIICNLVLFSAAFAILVKLLTTIKTKLLPED